MDMNAQNADDVDGGNVDTEVDADGTVFVVKRVVVWRHPAVRVDVFALQEIGRRCVQTLEFTSNPLFTLCDSLGTQRVVTQASSGHEAILLGDCASVCKPAGSVLVMRGDRRWLYVERHCLRGLLPHSLLSEEARDGYQFWQDLHTLDDVDGGGGAHGARSVLVGVPLARINANNPLHPIPGIDAPDASHAGGVSSAATAASSAASAGAASVGGAQEQCCLRVEIARDAVSGGASAVVRRGALLLANASAADAASSAPLVATMAQLRRALEPIGAMSDLLCWCESDGLPTALAGTSSGSPSVPRHVAVAELPRLSLAFVRTVLEAGDAHYVCREFSSYRLVLPSESLPAYVAELRAPLPASAVLVDRNSGEYALLAAADAPLRRFDDTWWSTSVYVRRMRADLAAQWRAACLTDSTLYHLYTLHPSGNLFSLSLSRCMLAH